MATDYLLPSEMKLYYDLRRWLAMLSDTGTPASESDLNTTTTDAYKSASALIYAASSVIDSRCQTGKRYDRTDLELIASDARANPTDAAKGKRFALLRQLTADLVWGTVMTRRGFAAADIEKLAPRYQSALEQLDQLYQGQAIFDLDAPKAAGVPQVATLGAQRLMSSQFNLMFGVWPDANDNYYSFGSWRY